MQQLDEIQRQLVGAILQGETLILPTEGAVQTHEALAVHRDTVIGGLVNALRLSFPTVDALVGERFFDAAGQQFAVSHPPRRPGLDEFGYQFMEFLRQLPTAGGLPYLSDVARLDWAIGQALRQPAETQQFALDAQVSLVLPKSLSVLRLTYPAHAIRAAIGDDQALAALDIAPSDHRILVWRKDDTAAVKDIRMEAGDFLSALIAGADVDTAMKAAGSDASAAAEAIQQDVFTASFCQIQTHSEDVP